MSLVVISSERSDERFLLLTVVEITKFPILRGINRLITKRITALPRITLGERSVTCYYLLSKSPTMEITTNESQHLFPVVTDVGTQSTVVV